MWINVHFFFHLLSFFLSQGDFTEKKSLLRTFFFLMVIKNGV